MKPVVLAGAGVVALFIGFWLYQDPRGLAAFTADGGAMLWDLTTKMFDAVIVFITELV